MNRVTSQQRGDTIVEVMIAIAVVSSILASAFAVVGRTNGNVQQIKEHSRAQKLLEGQIEQLKVAATKPDADAKIFNRLGQKAFCVQSSTVVDISSDTLPTAVANYNACHEDPQPAGSTGVSYYYGIVQTSPNTFTATAVWDSARGGQDRVELIYRLFK